MPLADPIPNSRQYLQWAQQRALAHRQRDRVPRTLDEWERRRTELRNRLLKAWGPFPQVAHRLEPGQLGELQRDGYRVEKVVLHPRLGIEMTTNVYVPAGDGPFPAVLCVHGHWRGAKQDPTVQARCLGLVKLGFLVLCVDAFGAGERGLKTELGEYHGEMVGATLWPTGLALSGLQVYENMRAVDYLQSRPDVDGRRIGVTGASGGGNQSMYVGAMDDRLKAVVPVCSVGTYQAYLGAACCLCEVVPGAISFTEESEILGLVSPRGLLVINATRDAFQFSVGEAQKSVAGAQAIFELHGADQQIRHVTFESPHDYNQAMRETMYGWMTLQLKGEGDGAPIPEPMFEVEDPEALRCYPGTSRPATFMTLPQFAAQSAREFLDRHVVPDHVEHWRSEQSLMRDSLEVLLGGPPDPGDIPAPPPFSAGESQREWTLVPEPGLTLPVREWKSSEPTRGSVLVLDLELGRATLDTPLAASLRSTGWNTLGIDLRATADLKHAGDGIQRAPDHNTAQWGVWLGYPLLAQWVSDLRRLLDQLEAEPSSPLLLPAIGVIGRGTAAAVALSLAALDNRLQRVATIGGLASYVSELPYERQRLAVMVPGILSQVGDMQHLAALLSPRPLIVAGGVDGSGAELDAERLRMAYMTTQLAYRLEDASEQLQIVPEAGAEFTTRWEPTR